MTHTFNQKLNKAKREKNDEFYTRYRDIEVELRHYYRLNQFKGKTILCNCNDAEDSNFYKYFKINFSNAFRDFKNNIPYHGFGTSRLIGINYERDGSPSYALSYTEDWDIPNENRIELKGNGDFRSAECIELLKESDIVVTNPPFSLFREYVAQLIEYDKKFLIIGNLNAIICKEIFPLIKNNQIWIGYAFGKAMDFIVPENYETKIEKKR